MRSFDADYISSECIERGWNKTLLIVAFYECLCEKVGAFIITNLYSLIIILSTHYLIFTLVKDVYQIN